MQPKNLDDLKQRLLFKEELREQLERSTARASAIDAEGLSGHGARSALAHLQNMEEQRADWPE
jgi:hypothetical protein